MPKLTDLATATPTATDLLMVQPASGAATKASSLSQIATGLTGTSNAVSTALAAKVAKDTVRVLASDYMVGDGTTDDTDGFQNMITAAEALTATGVDVTCVMPRRYYFNKTTAVQAGVLSNNNAGTRGWLTFDGMGSGIVKLSNNVFTMLKFNKLADGDTFSKIRVINLNVDGNNAMYGGAASAVVGFTGSTTVLMSRINVNNIEVRNVKTYNVPDPLAIASGAAYSTGTVALTNGANTVVGTGTTWTSNLVVGRVIYFKGNAYDPYVITAITDNTHITLDRNYSGTTASGQTYLFPGNVSAGWRGNVVIAVSDTTSAGSRYEIKDILIENVDFRGGNDGVYIIGYFTLGTAGGINVFCDNIRVKGWRHEQNTPAYLLGSSGFAGADDSVHVGSYARTGRVVIEDGYSAGTADGCVEVNQPQDATLRNLTLKNPYAVGMYLGTYGVYDTQAAAKVTVENVSITVDQDLSDARGISLFSNNSVPLGTVDIRGYKYSRLGAIDIPSSSGASGGISTSGSALIGRLNISDYLFEANGFNLLSSSGARRLTGLDFRSANAGTPMSVARVRGYRYYVNGTRDSAASALTCYGLTYSGSYMAIDIHGMDYDVTVAGTATTNGATAIENVGSVDNATLAVVNSSFRQSGDSAPRGINIRTSIATSQYLRPTTPIIFDKCDFTGLGAANEFNVVTSTNNRHAVIGTNIRNNAWPAPPVAASGSPLPLPVYGDMISVSGSSTVSYITPIAPNRTVTLRAPVGATPVIQAVNNLLLSTRQVTDGATTNTSATVTSATIAFTANDVGALITGAGVPAGTTISAVTNSTTATMSANATATASGVTLTLGNNLAMATDSSITLQCFRRGTYSTGTIAVTNGGTTVTGTSTSWNAAQSSTAFVCAGMLITIAGGTYLISSVDYTAQTLVIASTFTGTTIASGGSYTVDQYMFQEIGRRS